MQGKSTRQIAKAVGVAHKTVSRDLSTVSNDTVDNQPTEVNPDLDKPLAKSPSAPKRLSSLEIRSARDESTILANGNQGIQLIILRGTNVLVTKQSSDPRQVRLREARNKVCNLRRDVVATQACGGIVDRLEGIGNITDLLISHLGTLLTASSYALYGNCNSPRVKRNWRLYDDYFGRSN